MRAKKLKIASVIITHNRVDEVKAQMDIIRELWQPLFAQIDIYHEFNGKKQWYPAKYREDHLHYHQPMSHLTGVTQMLNYGIKHVLESNQKYDYIITSSADAWFYDPKKLRQVTLTCQNKKFPLAATLWGTVGLGTEFFIITPDLAKKVFPLKFTQIINKFSLLKRIPASFAIFEAIFALQVIKSLKNPNKIYLIPGRRIVWPNINRYWSPYFYASHHDQTQRKKDILPKIYSLLGDKIDNMPSLNKFLM